MDSLLRVIPFAIGLVGWGPAIAPVFTLQHNLDPAVLLTMVVVGILAVPIVRTLLPKDDPKAVACAIVALAGLKDLGEGWTKSVRWDDAPYATAHLVLFAQWCIVALSMLAADWVWRRLDQQGRRRPCTRH